jgi:hypothetical protein
MMDIERLKALNLALNKLYRLPREEDPGASVTEAIGTLIECMMFIFDSWESEHMKPAEYDD